MSLVYIILLFINILTFSKIMSKNILLLMYFGGYILFFFMPSFTSFVLLGEVFDFKLTYTFLKKESIEFILYCNIIVTCFIFIQSSFAKTYAYKSIIHRSSIVFDCLIAKFSLTLKSLIFFFYYCQAQKKMFFLFFY